MAAPCFSSFSGRGLSAESGTDDTEKLGEILQKGLAAGNCLILTADAVDKRKKIFKIITALGARALLR